MHICTFRVAKSILIICPLSPYSGGGAFPPPSSPRIFLAYAPTFRHLKRVAKREKEREVEKKAEDLAKL